MSYSELFELNPSLVHLNHAGISPWPRATVKAVTQFAYENASWGSRRYEMWLQEEWELRELGRWLLDAESKDEIAFLKNTSEGISAVAFGLDWKAGDNIVLAREEFPSNRIPWEAAATQHSVEIRWVDVNATDTPEQALLEQVDSRTRLLTTSSVHYASGLKMDLSMLGHALHDTPTLFCVDAIQSLGAHSLSVRESKIDFLAADAHKWMLGPEGIALFWVRPELYERLGLSQYGWHMVARAGHYEETAWEIAPDARRFECGSLNTLGIYALRASLNLLHEVGMIEIEERIADRIQQLDQSLRALECRILTPSEPNRRAGILTFAPPRRESEEVYKRLLERGILCAARGGGIRFSPHFYTPANALQFALETLQEILDSDP